jgi:hypothetical protein
MAIWYILWLLGMFFRFGYVFQEKYGTPGVNPTIVIYNASAVKI